MLISFSLFFIITQIYKKEQSFFIKYGVKCKIEIIFSLKTYLINKNFLPLPSLFLFCNFLLLSLHNPLKSSEKSPLKFDLFSYFYKLSFLQPIIIISYHFRFYVYFNLKTDYFPHHFSSLYITHQICTCFFVISMIIYY
jgi:hypothetical protein